MRDGDSLSHEQSLLTRNFGAGEPVMKIGLNDPKNKSIVLSNAEFSAEELGEAHPVSPAKSKKKRKSRKNAKLSQTRVIKTDINDIQTSIIKEEDDVDEYNALGSSKNKGGFLLNENSFLKLNEESVNVELDTSRNE